jgi:hypothetical protein
MVSKGYTNSLNPFNTGFGYTQYEVVCDIGASYFSA